MTGYEHYRRAEELLAAVESAHRNDDGTPIIRQEPETIAAAQVHATLALAAATALSQSGELHVPDAEGWEAAASALTRELAS